MKNIYRKSILKSIPLAIFFITLTFLKGGSSNAEYLFEDLEIDTSTKTEEPNAVLPNNPFEIVEMIRRQNSMNNATTPSDALDDALKSFNSMEEQ